MKKFIFSLLCLSLCFTAFSQEKGDLLLGVTSNLSSTELSDLSLQPNMAFGVTDNVFVGMGFTGIDSTVDLDLFARAYFVETTKGKVFVQGGFSTRTEEDSSVELSTGLTSFIGNTFFVEPTVSYNFGNVDTFGFNISFGVRL